jgi:hypothetical protein
MSAPERLNVLLSRARSCLILIGNAQTFMKSRKSKDAFTPFLNFLKDRGHLYDGLPVQCEQHPHKQFLLKNPEDFDIYCPDGGCSELW